MVGSVILFLLKDLLVTSNIMSALSLIILGTLVAYASAGYGRFGNGFGDAGYGGGYGGYASQGGAAWLSGISPFANLKSFSRSSLIDSDDNLRGLCSGFLQQPSYLNEILQNSQYSQYIGSQIGYNQGFGIPLSQYISGGHYRKFSHGSHRLALALKHIGRHHQFGGQLGSRKYFNKQHNFVQKSMQQSQSSYSHTESSSSSSNMQNFQNSGQQLIDQSAGGFGGYGGSGGYGYGSGGYGQGLGGF